MGCPGCGALRTPGEACRFCGRPAGGVSLRKLPAAAAGSVPGAPEPPAVPPAAERPAPSAAAVSRPVSIVKAPQPQPPPPVQTRWPAPLPGPGALADPGAPPVPSLLPTGGRVVVALVVLCVVTLLAVAGGVWWVTRAQPTPAVAVGNDVPASDATGPSPSDAAVAAPTTPAARSTTSTVAGPGTTVPSTGAVDLSGVAGEADAAAVGRTLQTYFAGVNAHDAGAALSVFAPDANIDPADPAAVARFAEGIATTVDDGVVVDDIRPTDAGVDVDIRFRSRQDPALGPEGQICTRWDLTYVMVRVGSRLLIQRTDGTTYQECGP